MVFMDLLSRSELIIHELVSSVADVDDRNVILVLQRRKL